MDYFEVGNLVFGTGTAMDETAIRSFVRGKDVTRNLL